MDATRISIALSKTALRWSKKSALPCLAIVVFTLALPRSIAAQVQTPATERVAGEQVFDDSELLARRDTVVREYYRKQEAVVREAFRETHDGWSSDEVLIRDDLNQAFIKRCHEQLPDAPEKELNWTLLNLRKAGKLDVKTTHFNDESYNNIEHLAEIAARSLQDKYEISSDAIMADPQRRKEFDEIALAIDPSANTYHVRKSALRLRKARQLQPELITRIADWSREIKEFTAAEVAADLELIPENPGIYLFRDKTGYLYVGEAINLRQRLKTHLDNSDRISLANYLNQQGADSISVEIHSFPADSRMKDVTVRRAYESELIRSRQPRFNVRP